MISKEGFEMQARLYQAMGHAARLEIVYILRDSSHMLMTWLRKWA